ncbi:MULTISPECIES: hypothetical protein [unclassified Paenibacillus]|uniref:hypothetical protein n=1 Tax=unclassified Paenibacillus TaxID=185978 RepID=UPI001044CE91|nr:MULTISPECIES: hypothetical protein [unclassified Paenibacillus]NIK69472.1 hypothetical protein [Paenibacillus sp. BK720]TCM95650.1 hypothetical protein EV294_10617 [Paenibacillus sp. BK033]
MDTGSDKIKQQMQTIPIPSEQLRYRARLGIEQAGREGRKAKRIRRGWTSIAAVIIVLLLSTALVNHTKVWAAIQNALQFIPGTGMVKQEKSPEERYILSKPITVKVGKEGTIIIKGMMSDHEMTYLTMTGQNTTRLKDVTLVNAQGEAFKIDTSMASWGGTVWTSSFWHKGELDVQGDIKLMMGEEAPVVVPIHLTKAESFDSYSELGLTSTVNGLSITAITDKVDGKARVSIIAPPRQDFRIIDYGIHGVYMHDESLKLHVVNKAGKKLEITTIQGLSSPQGELYFPLGRAPDESYTLTIPEINVEYQDEVKVKVPAETTNNLNQTFEIAGYPVTITRVEKTSPTTLRVYTDFHYDKQAPSSLYMIGAEESGMARLKEGTGEVEYLECTIEPGSKHLTLHINRPDVVLRGPWVFDFQPSNFSD